MAAGALADVGVAGRTLRSCFADEYSSSWTAALEVVQRAADVLQDAAAGSDVADLAVQCNVGA